MADVKAAAELTTPSPYVAAELNAARRRVEDHYRRLGFNRIEVDLQASVDGQSVALTVAVTEGTQDVLRSVEMSGREVTQGQVLTEAMRFELGQPVNLDTWALARKRLYDTNVFRLVDIQAVPAGDAVNGVQPVTALVTVQEYPQWSLRYGVQLEGDRTLELGEFTSTRNLGGVAELKNPNLFGRALTFGLSGLYEYDRRDATVFLGTSRLFGWRARSNLYGFVARERLRDDAGDAVVAIVDRQGVSADQRWRVGRFQVVYGYSYEHNRTYDPDPSPQDPLPLDFRASLAQVSGATFLDRRNDPINPRRGTFSSVSLDHAASWLGSDVSNWKVLAQQFVFVPVGPVVLASRAQAGGAFGRDILLPSDRFTAGGATTVRGYGEGSLGPRDALGVPVGGDTLVVLNQEARFPIYRWARGVAFVDAGNIFGRGESFDLGQLKVGYGVGLRLDSPVGLLRADVGFAATSLPTRRTQSADRVRWYFGFGHIF
jgi:outer membrane protein insertion porin family